MEQSKKRIEKTVTKMYLEVPIDVYQIIDGKKRSLDRNKTLQNAICKICQEWKADREKEVVNG